MNRFAIAALLSALATFAGTSMAEAQGVERSGATYHKQVCPGPAPSSAARCHAHVVTDRYGNPISQKATANTTPKGYSPSSLRSAYNVPWTGSSSDKPAGPVIAIVDAYGYGKAESDLAVYRKQFGLPACPSSAGCFTKLNQTGSATGPYPRNNTGWAQETALDLDMASALCPECKIVLVEANSANYNDLAAAELTAAARSPHVISNSYGGGESGVSQSNINAYNPPAGTAITVSSGDSGYGVQFPASASTVIATGGTSLTTANGVWSETAWSGAGSGCSTIVAAPAWQSTINNPCGNITVNGISTRARVEADTSAVADPNTGVSVYGPVVSTTSGWMVFGGTSVAAPLIAGVYGANGTLPSESTYGQHLYNNAASLNDIKTGSNGSCGAPLCQATTGYDGPTGLGTPNGSSAF